MLRIKIETPVNGNFKLIFEKFNKDLLEKLTPPLVKASIKRFDGSRVGDEVHLELNIFGVKQQWISKIIDSQESSTEFSFTDAGEGKELPFFLKKWKHIHRVKKDKNNAIIVDEVEFTTPFFLFDYLLYPMLYYQFWWRKSKYKKYLGRD